MRFTRCVLAGLSAVAVGVQAVPDPPGYDKKPDYGDYGHPPPPPYPDYGKKPDYPEKPNYPEKPHYPEKHCHPEKPDCPKEPEYHEKQDHHEGYGHAKVVNFCPYEVYLWSVAWDTDGPYTIGCRQEYVEKYLKGGVALEIVTDKESWYKDEEKLILYYKKYDKKVYYDLYEKYGHPFDGHKVSLKPEEDYCPAEYWDDGCEVDDGGKKTCDDFSDLVLYLCEEYKDKEYPPPPPYHKPPPPPEYPPYSPKYPDYPKKPDYSPPEPPKYPLPPPPQQPYPDYGSPAPPKYPLPLPEQPYPPYPPHPPYQPPQPPSVPLPDLQKLPDVPGLPVPPVPPITPPEVPKLPLPVPLPDLPNWPDLPDAPELPVTPVSPMTPPDLPSLARRRYNRARYVEGQGESDDGQDWHARQWENDKPSWDTEVKCTDCGERAKGSVVDTTPNSE